MAGSWEERFYEDVLPAIRDYVEEEESEFESSDLIDYLEDYSSSEIGRTLKYVVKKDITDHIQILENCPKKWKVVYDTLEGQPYFEELDQEFNWEEDTVNEDEKLEELEKEVAQEDNLSYSGLYSMVSEKFDTKDPQRIKRLMDRLEEDYDINEYLK
ncbi:MAG: hypothetical protein ABEI78_00285 [Candidatus Nanohaloarchaea archaeon]